MKRDGGGLGSDRVDGATANARAIVSALYMHGCSIVYDVYTYVVLLFFSAFLSSALIVPPQARYFHSVEFRRLKHKYTLTFD